MRQNGLPILAPSVSSCVFFSMMALTEKQIDRLVDHVVASGHLWKSGVFSDDFKDWADDALKTSRRERMKMAAARIAKSARALNYRLDAADRAEAVQGLLDQIDDYDDYLHGG